MHLRGASSEQFINGAGHRELPVVVPNGLLFVWLAHYTSPSFADRSVYLTEDPPPNDPNWADTLDKGIQLLQSYWPIRVKNFPEFTSARREFLLYVEEQNPGRAWLTVRLIREGWSLQTVALDEYRRVYLVTSNGHTSLQ